MFPKINSCDCGSFIEEEDLKDQRHRMGMDVITAYTVCDTHTVSVCVGVHIASTGSRIVSLLISC